MIPPAAWAITELLGIPDPFAIGIILVGATAAGPLSVVAVQIARGDAILALATVTSLEIANAVAVPVWAGLLLPRSATVPIATVAAVLVAGVLAPIVVGSITRLRAAALADRLVPVARRVSMVGLVVVIAIVLAGNAEVVVTGAAAGVLLATVLVMAFALAGGWLIGGPSPASRLVIALVSAQRGSSIALAIAVTAFADIPEVAVAVAAFGIISVVVVPAMGVLARGRVPAPGEAATA